MSFLEIALEQAKEPEVAPEGEYDLRIHEAVVEEGKKPGSTNVRVMVMIEDHPECQPIFNYLSLPNPSDEEKSKTFKLLNFKRFLTLFDVPFEGNGFSTEDMTGATAKARLTIEEYEGRLGNVIFVPRLAE